MYVNNFLLWANCEKFIVFLKGLTGGGGGHINYTTTIPPMVHITVAMALRTEKATLIFLRSEIRPALTHELLLCQSGFI
jgi:hypothetical protein